MVRVLTKIRYHVKSGFRHGFKNIIFSKFFFGFVASIGVILSSHDKTGRIKDNLNARLNDQEDTFDFVIVGGGTAGSLLANRLSEQHKVLLLEAGGEPHPLQRIPGMALFMLNYRETDWMHRTVPQRRACFSSPGRRAGWCGGRTLGGSSNINYMVHMRGSPRDYDNWAKVTGDQSWSYEALLHYFRRHENYQGDSPDREAHGFDGDMMLEGPSYTGMAKEFIRAGQELGYEHVDLNARFEEGFDSIYSPMEMGERKASFHAFLEPVRDRETLSVRKYSRVTKILIRSFDNTAFGVEYERHGVKKYAYATKEVILCAGAVESPKLLMLSGIGPRTHLADLGIPVVADLPVGKNLQDHLAVLLGPFFVDPPRSFLIDRDITLKSFYEYKSDGNGPLSSSIFQAAAMISSKRAKVSQEWNWPDILLLLSGLAGHKTFARDMSHAFNLNQKLIKKYYHHAAGRDSFIIFVSAARPQGRGDVTLEKKDADAPPSINPHYLENDSDMKTTIEGIKTALYLVENTTSFQNLRARFTNKKFPGCDHMPFRSDEYWECYTRHFSVSLNDGAGTCAMGHPDMNLFGEGNGWGKEYAGGGMFLGAVVDPKLQVIGINHLRVADASIMPHITGSQTQAATLMIAEKAADLVNEAWSQNENGPPMTTYKPFGWSEQMPAGPPQQHIGPPPQQYGPPPQQQQQQYGPPPQNQYGPPPPQQPPQQTQQYGPPPPPQNGYGPPPPAPPPMPQYGPPMPNQQYGPPMPPQQPPQQQYGPPMPPPQQGGYASPPQQNYGAPPPNPQYGAPPETSYGPPSTMLTTMMMNGEGGYTDMSTSSEPPMMEQMSNVGESQQMSEFDEMSTPPDETTTMMSTTGSTSTMSTTSTTSMEPPMMSYGPPPGMDSSVDTTTLFPNTLYGPPNFQAGSALYNGWSGAGAYLDTQYGVPPQQNNEISRNHDNSPSPYFTAPGDSTTAASSTTGITSTENFGDSPAPYLTPPPGDRAEPPYQPQLGNPLFGGGQDPRNIPPAGDTDTSSTTVSSVSGRDPPEENAPAAGAFDPVITGADSITSESSAVETTTFRSFYNTDNPSGTGSTAAARPDVGFMEHDTKLRPGVQISNPFPDIFYATQEGGAATSGSDVPESFFQKYPLTSSVEFGNKIPSLPKISNGPLFFRNPESTSRRPIVFGELLKKETSAPSNEVIVDTTPYPFISTGKFHFNKSAVAISRTSSEMPAFVPYYNDKNRRPDEGTVKPTVLYKSVSQTNKVPSTANVPNIYYSVKDEVSKKGILFDGDHHDEVMQTSDGPPVMFAPTGPPPPPLRTSPSPIPAGVSGTSAAFGGSAAGSSNYWTNASPKPEVTDNLIPVEVQHGKDSNGYWTNASPKPKLVATPRGMDNSISIDSIFPGNNGKRPVRLRALRRKHKDKDTDDKQSRIVRIKSDIVWTTTQRPSLTTTFQPNQLGDHEDDIMDRLGSAGRVKIRVRTKEVALEEDLDEAIPVLSPYWSQGNKTATMIPKGSTTTPRPQTAISGTSTPTSAVYDYQQSASTSTTEQVMTVTPRPMLSVQVYPSKEMEQAPPFPEGGMSATMATLADDTGMYLSHPGFGFDQDTESQGQAPWQEMNNMGMGGGDGDSFGVASVLPASPHATDDQTPGETLLLSNILGSVLRGGGRRRRPPGPPPPLASPAPFGNNHYDGNMVTGSTARPPPPGPGPEFSASGNSATKFMQTQVPDFFVQDDPEGPRDVDFHENDENRKRFTAHDGLNSHNHGDYGHTGGSGHSNYHDNHHTGPSGHHHQYPTGSTDQHHHPTGPGDNHHHPTGPTGHHPTGPADHHHHPTGPTGHHHPTGPSGHHHQTGPSAHHGPGSSEIPPPHHFDSAERDRFNLFNNNGASGPIQPPQGPPPIQHPHSYNHNGNNFPPPSPTAHQQQLDQQQYHKPEVRLPPPLNPNFQVTTPGNDFSSPAYDENPLQFYRDATPQIPDRFQLGPTNRPSQVPSHQPPRQNGNFNDYPTDNVGNYPPQQQQQNHNNYHAQPTGPPPPNFIDNSRELGQGHFGGGGLTGPSNGFNDIGGRFPPHPSPTPSVSPIPPSTNAFGLGHSAPVGIGGGNSPPQSKGIGSPPPHLQNIHNPPRQPFELPPRFAGLPIPEDSLPPPPLPPFNDDLGQIPDIFGFRNVLPSTVPPPVVSAPPPTGPGPSSRPHHHHQQQHQQQQHHQSPTPNFQDEFSVPQFVDPPTTALQQSIHNILSGPSPTTPQQGPIGFPSPTGSSDLPQFLGDSTPKVYHDGVDPSKISLTYDDTGANGFLDPPVIMGEHGSSKHHHVDINQISLTPSPGPNGPLNDNRHHHHHQQNNQNNFQSGGHGSPSGPSGGTGPQFQESKHEDVTQTREQILSQFGPQQDPEDHAQGDVFTPSSSHRPPHQQPTRRPFGTRPKNGNRHRHKNPFDEFGDPNLYQDNPFAELLLPQKTRQQNHQVSSTPSPQQQQQSQFGTPTPHPSDGFSVTPFESPDFTRFEISGHSPGSGVLDPNQFPSSVAPPQLDSDGQNTPKLKEYTIYSNPDDVDITVDQGQRGGGGFGARGNGFGGQGQLRRRSDVGNGKRRKRRRHHGGRGNGDADSTRRGGRAIRLRPLWGGDSRTPTKGRRRYYMVKDGENGTTATIPTTPIMDSVTAASAVPEVREMLQKRTSVEMINGTGNTGGGDEDSEMAALSRELLNSFLGFGFGTEEGEEHKTMLEQLLRNATEGPPVGGGRAGMSMEEDDLDDSSSGANVSKFSGEDLSYMFMTRSTSTTASTPTTLTTIFTSSPKPTEWTPVEAATTNATITLSTATDASVFTEDSVQQSSRRTTTEVVTSSVSVTSSTSSSESRSSTDRSTAPVAVSSISSSNRVVANREAG